MDKDNLFTIGMLSKITGVHIKSLYYYEEIGILQPVYIDEITKYRYFSQNEIILVANIQFCVELDIPLKNFHNFFQIIIFFTISYFLLVVKLRKGKSR